MGATKVRAPCAWSQLRSREYLRCSAAWVCTLCALCTHAHPDYSCMAQAVPIEDPGFNSPHRSITQDGRAGSFDY